MRKRLFDVFFATSGLIVLLPFLLIIACIIKITSFGPVFYLQERVGLHGKIFLLYKFRSMKTNSDSQGLLTIGNRDDRITVIGYYIRKYKLDELPQLINVLKSDMSFVGPRPEVEKYVKLYTHDQTSVLNVKPGITDMASILYRNESELLRKSTNPEKLYITEILPAKIKINLKYIEYNNTIVGSIQIIILTLKAILFNRHLNVQT